MNILLWVLQAALAFLYVAGGSFKVFKFDELARHFTVLPHAGWRALGVLEVVGAVLLIVPAATHWMPILTLGAAALLALENLTLAAVLSRYSTKLTAQNPMVWNLVIGLITAFVAYGRYALSPLT